MHVQARRRAPVVAVVTLVVATLAVLIPAPPADANIDISVTTESSALNIARTFVAPDVLVTASFVYRAGTTAAGIGTNGTDSPWPTAGDNFAVLSSGDVTIAPNPNTSGSSGVSLGGPNRRGNTDFDVTILKVDVDVPDAVNCLVGIDFQFFSDEYPEFVGSRFNDAFIAELDQSTWTTSGSEIDAPDNFAFDEAGDPITINTVGATTMTPAEAAGTTYDGATPLLRATTPITPGAHSLYFSIFDQGDRIYDSAVFIDNLQFGTVADVARDCKPGAAPAEQFVYVALGDSYSSGEGAPPFEDGINYPFNDPQENTLTDRFGGNGCHRSLINYAKNNDGRFEPDQPFALVDRTCSGAKIEPGLGSKAPISRTRNTPPSQFTQVDEALNRLGSNFGFVGDDVDLVTMTMGGNDAQFGEIVFACLIPNLARELFRAYPDTPGEVEFLVERFGSCSRFDGLFFDTADALDTLPQKELDGQSHILEQFPEARVLQLTYPSIVPDENDFGGEVCGGIRKGDADYARDRVSEINDIIRGAILFQRVIRDEDRIQVVDIENAFGENPLCPANADEALAVGLDQARLRATVEDLVADPDARPLLDRVVNRYEDLRNCLAAVAPTLFPPSPLPIIGGAVCAFFYDRLDDAIGDLIGFFQEPGRLDSIVAGLAPGANEDERFENSRNLFHPTAKGYVVMACQVLEVYQFGSTSGACAPTSMGIKVYEWDGVPLGTVSPIQLVPGETVGFRINGWDLGQPVIVRLFSDPVLLGEFVPDAAGEIAGDITIPPDAPPGVHKVEFSGSNGGKQRLVEVLVEIPGRPVARQSYGLYFEGFTPGENVTITNGGVVWVVTPANQDGGVFTEIPVPDPLVPAALEVSATGEDSGISVAQVLIPTPSSAALWATSEADDAITLRGTPDVTGFVHSEGGIDVGGDAAMSSGAEYATTIAIEGSATADPEPVVLALEDVPPVSVVADDWRPGGPVAAALGDDYRAIPPEKCEDGTWKPKAEDLAGAVIYVPCDVQLSGNLEQVAATIVAEGAVKVNANDAEFAPADGRPALVSLAAGVDVSSSGSTFRGPVVAATLASVSGADHLFACGIYAAAISISGGSSTFAACRVEDL